MKKFLKASLTMAALAVMIGLASSAAYAAPVQFSTTVCFGAPCTPVASSSVALTGGGTLTLTGQPGTLLDTPVVADLGQFTFAGLGTGSSTLAPTRFTVQINQTIPTVGTGSFMGSISGTVTASSGFFVATFDSPTSFSIGTITYQLVNIDAQNRLFLDPTATGGITRISALVTGGQVIPEPATVVLLGIGLAGVAGAVRRQHKANKG